MTNADHVLKIDDPGELLETVPYLLGFHPEDSVVLVGHTDDHVVVTARMDLAVAETDVLHDGVQVLLRASATMVIVVVYAAAADPPMRGVSVETRLPHEVCAHHVTDELDRAGLRVIDVIFVQDGRWWSYPGRARGCPDCVQGSDLPGDGAAGPAAAVFAGLQARPNRQALEAVVEQLPATHRQRHDVGLAAAEQRLAKAATDGHLDRELRSIKRALFAEARETDNALFPRPVAEVPSATLCRYAAGLGEITVRDSIWLAIDQNRLDGRGLWLSMLQRLPSPYDSAPLFLFGWASWRDGNGTLAAMAAERALISNPGYTAAELLLSAVQHGLDPRSIPRLRLPPLPTGRPPARPRRG